MKPTNVMLEQGKNGDLSVVLIDFGFSKKYVTDEGVHISDGEQLERFQGNIMFSSTDQMNFK